jgi:hypothetical protein
LLSAWHGGVRTYGQSTDDAEYRDDICKVQVEGEAPGEVIWIIGQSVQEDGGEDVGSERCRGYEEGNKSEGIYQPSVRSLSSPNLLQPRRLT